MRVSEYQRWLEEWDRARGWHRVSPSHTLIHALEEMGEVARLVLQLEGYKEAASEATVRAALERELSDLFVFLFKLSYQCGIDVEAALQAGQAKADERWGDLAAANAELERYLAQQAENLAQMSGESEMSPQRGENVDGTEQGCQDRA
jgi:NTP pyrophosphatase (non-canonical NTP hydrolase)